MLGKESREISLASFVNIQYTDVGMCQIYHSREKYINKYLQNNKMDINFAIVIRVQKI